MAKAVCPTLPTIAFAERPGRLSLPDMRSWLALGRWVALAILGALIVVSIVDCFAHRAHVRDCLSRGGKMIQTDCPEPRGWCTSTGRSTVCAELSCKQRCLEQPPPTPR